jgi:hypothetical protein
MNVMTHPHCDRCGCTGKGLLSRLRLGNVAETLLVQSGQGHNGPRIFPLAQQILGMDIHEDKENS